jgi:hypothetical protein
MHNDRINRWAVLAATAALLTVLGAEVLAVTSTYSAREGRTQTAEWRPNQRNVEPLMELVVWRTENAAGVAPSGSRV